jgi:hypothetical protein
MLTRFLSGQRISPLLLLCLSSPVVAWAKATSASGAEACSTTGDGVWDLLLKTLQALTPILVVVIGYFISKQLAQQNGAVEANLAAQRDAFNEKLEQQKGELEKQLAEQKAILDNRASYAAEAIARKLLMHPQWKMRSFNQIQGKLGGFEEDLLRRILVQAGAVRFRDQGGKELWGLVDRNEEALSSKSN